MADLSLNRSSGTVSTPTSDAPDAVSVWERTIGGSSLPFLSKSQDPKSIAVRALRLKTLKKTQLENSVRALGLLRAFFPATSGQEIPEPIRLLAKEVQDGKTLAKAFASLPSHAQQEIHQKAGRALGELFSLAEFGDTELFWHGALHFGLRLKLARRMEPAAGVLGMLAGEGVPPEVRAQAESEFNALLGKGSSGLRTEFLLGSLADQATDYRMIAPMIGGSFVGKAVGTALLGRLAGASRVGWFTRGLGARALAGTTGFFAEATVFGLGARALQENPQGSATDDLLRSGLSLGALRLFGFLGNQGFLKLHGFSELGVPARLTGLARINRVLIPQASMFGGLVAAHQLEEKVGLRPKVEGATMVVDTLGAMLSMQVGTHLGHRLLGPGFAQFEADLGIRSKIYSERLANKSWEMSEGRERAGLSFGLFDPALATAEGPRRYLLHMSTHGEGQGPGGSGGGGVSIRPMDFLPGKTNPTHVIRDLRLFAGEKVEVVEAGMRPSSEGKMAFLGPKEGLLEVMARDNDYVLSRGTTHQEVARELKALIAKGSSFRERPGAFTFHGEDWYLQIHDAEKFPQNLFPDIPSGNVGYTLVNIKQQKTLQVRADLLEAIERYGFYGGEAGDFRLSPQDILATLPRLARRQGDPHSPVAPSDSLPKTEGQISPPEVSSLGGAKDSPQSFPPGSQQHFLELSERLFVQGDASAWVEYREYLRTDPAAGPPYHQLVTEYREEISRLGHHKVYGDLGITSEILADTLSASVLLSAKVHLTGADPTGWVDFILGKSPVRLDPKQIEHYFQYALGPWVRSGKIEGMPPSTQEALVAAAERDPVLLSILGMLAAQGRNWAEAGLRKIEAERNKETRISLAELRLISLGIQGPGFRQGKDNPFHPSDNFVLMMSPEKGRALRSPAPSQDKEDKDYFLERIHLGDWPAITRLVDRAQHDAAAFSTLQQLTRTHEAGRWITDLALDGDATCQQALLEAAKTDPSIRAFLLYLSPADHPWAVEFQAVHSYLPEPTLTPKDLFFAHRLAKMGNPEARERMKNDALRGFRLEEIAAAPVIYSGELADLILLAQAENPRAVEFLDGLWSEMQESPDIKSQAEIRKAFSMAARATHDVLPALRDEARRGRPWAQETLQVLNPIPFLPEAAHDGRVLEGLFAMAEFGNGEAEPALEKYFDLVLKIVSGNKPRVYDFTRERSLLSELAKWRTDQLQPRALDAVNAALRDYGSRYGLKGLEGRVKRGLDPAGMLAVPNTREKAREIAYGLGATMETLTQLTNELHTGGIWKNAALLAKAEAPAVLAWMVLAHLTSEGEKTPQEFVHDWARVVRDLDDAAKDPQDAAFSARQDLVERAREKFTVIDGVPYSENDAFLEMAINGHAFGVVREKSGLLFVGAKQLDYSILDRMGLSPVEKEDRGRKAVFYVDSEGRDVVKRLYDGLAIVFDGNLELARVLARTGGTSTRATTGTLAGDVALLFLADVASTWLEFETDGEIRRDHWQELAKDHPGFEKKIWELREVFKVVEASKRVNAGEVEEVLEGYFENYTELTRALLTTFLWHRLMAQGKTGLPIQAQAEAGQLLKDFGLSKLSEEQAYRLPPEAILEKFLGGDVGLPSLPADLKGPVIFEPMSVENFPSSSVGGASTVEKFGLKLQVSILPEGAVPNPEKIQPVVNRPVAGPNKPYSGGFWTSSQHEEDISPWVAYASFEGHIRGPSRVWHLEPKPGARIYVVNDYQDYMALLKDYGRVDKVKIRSIDFEKLAQDFDGLHITAGGIKQVGFADVGRENMDLFAWDTEQTLWFRWAFGEASDQGSLQAQLKKKWGPDVYDEIKLDDIDDAD